MGNDNYKTFLIGLFVIIACIGAVAALLFLRPAVGDEGKIIHVRFSDISGISVGTRVTFAGQPVGQVTSISEIQDAREHPVNDLGQAYFYELTLAIDSSVDVYDTDEFAIRSTGLLGEKTVSIIPRVGTPEHPSVPLTNQMMYGNAGDPFEQTINQLMLVGNKAATTLDKISAMIDSNSPEIQATLKSFQATSNNMNELLAQAKKNGLIDHVSNMTARVATLTAELQEKHFGHSLGDLTLNLAGITKSINDPLILKEIMANVNEITKGLGQLMPDLEKLLNNAAVFTGAIADGKGTVGKLIMDDELYKTLDAILSKADLLMSDINHYGILFQMNRNWKRESLDRQRAADTNCITPNSVSYFQTELNMINGSLSYIKELIEQNEEQARAIDNNHFGKGLITLKNRIEQIQESFNQAPVCTHHSED